MSLAAGDARRSLRGQLSLESLVVGALVLYGYRAGFKGISDNSAFVHIRTGIEMLRHWSIPRHDPYSFTAPGHAWVVQSWLASALYGAAYHVAGMHLVEFVNGLLGASLAFVVARLARAGTMLRTLPPAALAVIGGSVYWAPRPLMIGLLALAILILVVEQRASPWWLLPVGWIWVNSHGSFPLGLAWIAARGVGEAIDTRARPKWIERYALAFVASLVLGGINPLGPKLLAFPLTVQEKASVFKNVVEWHSPDFQSPQGVFTVVCLTAALVILFQRRQRWSDILPVAGFLALGLVSLRNISPAWVVLAPALGHAMRREPSAPPVGSETVSEPKASAAVGSRGTSRINVAFAGVLVVAAVAFTVGGQRAQALDLASYPTRAEDYMARHGLLDPAQHRVAAQDIVGCYLILLRGPRGKVFIDDRVDMYPVTVSQDYDDLLHGGIDAPAVLDRYRIDVVLWDRRLPLPGILHAAGGWRTVYPEPGAPASGPGSDTRWTVMVRDASVAPQPA